MEKSAPDWTHSFNGSSHFKLVKMCGRVLNCLSLPSGNYALLQILHALFFQQAQLPQFLYAVQKKLNIQSFIPKEKDLMMLVNTNGLNSTDILCVNVVNVDQFEYNLPKLYLMLCYRNGKK